MPHSTPIPTPTPTPDPTLSHPRLLLLHGGGTNATIFRAQCRALLPALTPTFRPVFATAPFPCPPVPDILPIYQHHGPYRSWLRGRDADGAEPDAEATWWEIETALAEAMREDDARGAWGEWIGVVGFSQGGKVAGSVVGRVQGDMGMGMGMGKGLGREVEGLRGVRFGVVMAGRGPLVGMEGDKDGDGKGVLRMPTVHVHGVLDPGLDMHRKLLGWCVEGSARVVEWEGAHRVPIRTADVRLVVDAILAVAVETGVLIDRSYGEK